MAQTPEANENAMRVIGQQTVDADLQQNRQTQERLVSSGRQSIPILGHDFLDIIVETEARPEELPPVIEEFLAAKEGLVFGPDFYDLSQKEQRVSLEDMFLTVEGGSRRESLPYPEQALMNILQIPVRDIKRKARRENRSLTREEDKTVHELTGMQNLLNSRELFDGAYLQRMNTCQVAEQGAELVGKDKHYRDGISPDRVVWEQLFKGDFGELTDRVLRRMVANSLTEEELQEIKNKRANYEVFPGELAKKNWSGRDLYINGIRKSDTFVNWLQDALSASKKEMTSRERMDIVWFAWRLALVWEIPSELGYKIDEKGKFQIAEPPIGNDFFVWSDHLEAKRTLEYGLDEKGMRERFGRYITHSGYPVSLGRIQKREIVYERNNDGSYKLDRDGKRILDKNKRGDPIPLLGSFLREAKIDEVTYEKDRDGNYILDREGKKTPQFKYERNDKGEFIRDNRGQKVLELDKDGKPIVDIRKVSLWELWWERGIKLADLPWTATEIDQNTGLNEFPTGNFGFWLLQRTRAFPIIQDIRSRPSLRDIGGDADFFAKRVRNWDKIFGIVDEKLKPEENPRMWWVLGLLVAHHPSGPQSIPIVREMGLTKAGYGTAVPSETWSNAEKGKEEGIPSIYTILNSAMRCGFIRYKDTEEIIKKLGLAMDSSGKVTIDTSIPKNL